MSHSLRSIALVTLLSIAGLSSSAEEKQSPEQQAKAAADFAHGYAENWTKDYTKRVTGFAEEIAKHCALDEAQTKALVGAAEPFGLAVSEHWEKLYVGYYAPHLKLWGEDNYWDDYLDLCRSAEASAGRKVLAEKWDAMLKKQLSGEAYALWQGEMIKRREWRMRARDSAIKIQLDKIEKSVRSDFEQRLQAMTSAAKLSADRSKELAHAVDAAVVAHLAVRRPVAEKTGLWVDEEFFRYAAKSLTAWEKEGKMGDIMFAAQANKAANKAFDEAWLKLASPDEQKAMKTLAVSREQRIAKMAKTMVERNLDNLKARDISWQMEARADALAMEISLDAPRKAKLIESLKAADKVIIDEWRKAGEAYISKQLGSRRSNNGSDSWMSDYENGRSWYSTEDEANKNAVSAKEKAWTEAVKNLLKPEEFELWKNAREEKSGEARAMLTQLAVAELDRKLLLLPEQRAKLEELAKKAVEGYDIDVNALLEFLNNYGMNNCQALLGGMDAKAVNAILDEHQKKTLEDIQKNFVSYWSNLTRCMKKKS